MAKEQIQVILVETFKGEKYLLTLDRDYEQALMNLFRKLLKNAPLGSLAHISLRNMKEKEYNEIPLTAGFMEQKGKEDDKENRTSKDVNN